MRVEIRAEVDEHEYAVTLECDRSIDMKHAIEVVSFALLALDPESSTS